MVKDSIEPTLDEVLQPGKNMVAAGYCMYGSSCTVQICWTFTFLTFTLNFTFGDTMEDHLAPTPK